MKSRHIFLAVSSAIALVTGPVQAAQLVVVDADYTHGPATTKDSHFPVVVPQGTPTNWTSPVNYAGGQAVVELEVKTKPSDAATRFQVCFITKPDYTCTDQSPVYTETGTITWATSFSKFYIGNNGSVDFAQGAKDITLILKDTKNVKPAPENVGAETSALYMPTDLHVTVTFVPEGETYEPPNMQPSGGAGGLGGGAGSTTGGAAGAGGLTTGGNDAGGSASVAGGMASAGAPVSAVPEPIAGTGGQASGGSAALEAAPGNEATDAGCSCSVPAAPVSSSHAWLGLLAALAVWLRRSHRR